MRPSTLSTRSLQEQQLLMNHSLRSVCICDTMIHMKGETTDAKRYFCKSTLFLLVPYINFVLCLFSPLFSPFLLPCLMYGAQCILLVVGWQTARQQMKVYLLWQQQFVDTHKKDLQCSAEDSHCPAIKLRSIVQLKNHHFQKT